MKDFHKKSKGKRRQQGHAWTRNHTPQGEEMKDFHKKNKGKRRPQGHARTRNHTPQGAEMKRQFRALAPSDLVPTLCPTLCRSQRKN